MSQPSLLDLLEPTGPETVHALMPWMGLGCEADYVRLDRSHRATTRWDDTTCAGCTSAVAQYRKAKP